MTIPGLSFFYAGIVRSKNVLSVLMQCFAITCMVSILWVMYAYSLAFGEGNSWIGDLSKVFMAGVGKDSMSGDIPESVFSMFQLTFAIITPALIVGAFAERMKFSAMLLFSALWVTLVYAPITHWVWGGGWLGQMGLLDFAGGTVVHVTAGVAALVAVISTLVYTAIITFIILKVVDIIIGLRVTKEEEIEGLDVILHEERGYII